MEDKQTSTFFDSYAEKFDSIYQTKRSWVNSILNSLFRKSMFLRYKLTLEGCDPIEGMTVFDIGCGPGHYSIALAKMGAKFVLGIDFASSMIEIAKERAKFYNVEEQCQFLVADFFAFEPSEKFDYSIAMGFMDYMQNPKEVIEKVAKVTKRKAFFSFPSDKGFLAWQRKIRYKWKCPLYLYSEEKIRELFKDFPPEKVQIKKIQRDYFVTLLLD